MISIKFIIQSWHYFADPFKLQPMAELYLATVLRDKLDSDRYNVSVFDMRESRREFVGKGINYDYMNNIEESDIYIFWISKTADSIEAYETANYLKKKYPKSITIGGGVHVENIPNDAYEKFDKIIIGPGEETLYRAVMDFENGFDNKKYIDSWSNIEYPKYPFMDRSFLPENSIVNRDLFKMYNGELATSFLFARGCNFHCSYCVYNIPNHIQRRLNSQVETEILAVKKDYKIEAINLRDEIAIPLQEDIAIPFIETLARFNMPWRGQTRVGATEKVIQLAAESGCIELAIGLESVSQVALDAVKKGQKVDKALDFFRMCKKYGIKVKMCLIMGLPGEPANIVEKTIKVIEDVNPDYVNVSGFLPVPGSEIFQNYKKYAIKYIDKDWTKHAHLMFRYGDDDFGLPFEYEKNGPWGENFSREDIMNNIAQLQQYLRNRNKVY